MRKSQKKRRERASKPPAVAQVAAVPQTRQPRNPALDTLRGIAIVLMVVDHAADMLFGQRIEPDNIRIVTRLSMPLFCVLMGYFLYGRKEIRWNRFWQICVAAVAANCIYLPLYGRLEILASLLVCTLLVGLLRQYSIFLLGLAFAVEIDPSGIVFDYPLGVCAAMLGLGMVVRKYPPQVGLLVSLLLPLASLRVATPTAYVMWFAPLAVGLVYLAAAKKAPDLRGLRDVGRYPLTVYVLQYYGLLVIREIFVNR